MKTLLKFTFIGICITLLFACEGQGADMSDFTAKAGYLSEEKYANNESTEMDEGESLEQREDGNIDTEKEKTIERKLIKEGNIRFETADIDNTTAQVHDAVKNHNGYISSEDSYKYSNSTEHTITVRMPAKSFDSFLAAVTKGVEQLDNKNIQVKDVTEEFVDIQARLKTKKELEARYTELLAKANSVEEILQVERELGDIRTQIESAEGRLKYLRDRVAYSTLTISFYKKTVSSIGFGGKFGRGLENGWNNLLWFLVGLVNIWPFLLIIIGLVWFIVRKVKARRKKRANNI